MVTGEVLALLSDLPAPEVVVGVGVVEIMVEVWAEEAKVVVGGGVVLVVVMVEPVETQQ